MTRLMETLASAENSGLELNLSDWGQFSSVEPLAGGNRNRVFEISGEMGRFVLKSTQRSEDAVAWIDRVHASAELAGLRVPRYVKSRNGKFVENHWTLEEYVVGTQATKAKSLILKKKMKRFQELTKSTPQRPGFASATELIAVDKGGDIDLTQMPAELVRECGRAWRVLRRVPHAVVHGDLSPSNILIDDRGDLALIDWDEARVDAIAFDDVELSPASESADSLRRAVLAWEVACSWLVEPEYAARLAHVFLAACLTNSQDP